MSASNGGHGLFPPADSKNEFMKPLVDLLNNIPRRLRLLQDRFAVEGSYFYPEIRALFSPKKTKEQLDGEIKKASSCPLKDYYPLTSGEHSCLSDRSRYNLTNYWRAASNVDRFAPEVISDEVLTEALLAADEETAIQYFSSSIIKRVSPDALLQVYLKFKDSKDFRATLERPLDCSIDKNALLTRRFLLKSFNPEHLKKIIADEKLYPIFIAQLSDRIDYSLLHRQEMLHIKESIEILRKRLIDEAGLPARFDDEVAEQKSIAELDPELANAKILFDKDYQEKLLQDPIGFHLKLLKCMPCYPFTTKEAEGSINFEKVKKYGNHFIVKFSHYMQREMQRVFFVENKKAIDDLDNKLKRAKAAYKDLVGPYNDALKNVRAEESKYSEAKVIVTRMEATIQRRRVRAMDTMRVQPPDESLLKPDELESFRKASLVCKEIQLQKQNLLRLKEEIEIHEAEIKDARDKMEVLYSPIKNLKKRELLKEIVKVFAPKDQVDEEEAEDLTKALVLYQEPSESDLKSDSKEQNEDLTLEDLKILSQHASYQVVKSLDKSVLDAGMDQMIGIWEVSNKKEYKDIKSLKSSVLDAAMNEFLTNFSDEISAEHYATAAAKAIYSSRYREMISVERLFAAGEKNANAAKIILSSALVHLFTPIGLRHLYLAHQEKPEFGAFLSDPRRNAIQANAFLIFFLKMDFHMEPRALQQLLLKEPRWLDILHSHFECMDSRKRHRHKMSASLETAISSLKKAGKNPYEILELKENCLNHEIDEQVKSKRDETLKKMRDHKISEKEAGVQRQLFNEAGLVLKDREAREYFRLPKIAQASARRSRTQPR